MMVAAIALLASAHAREVAPAPVSELIRAVDIPYESFTLPNGLRVIVHTDRKAPVVALSVWYDVGSKHEPKGKTGFAHLFEHLMFNGSENAPGDYFEPLRQIGATDLNGTTYFDRTNYYETVPGPTLERALFLESDRMGYLLGAITQATLDEQRGVVQNEKRQGDNQPYGLVMYRVLEGLFPDGHPYGHSTIGSMADLDAASLADVKGWFRSHYGPNNAVLVLAGDIDAATARPLVEKYFGAIPAGPKTVAPVVSVPTLAEPKRIAMKDRVAATMITKVWAVPGLNDPDAVPLDIAASVLGGLASSRLDNALVRQEKLAVSVAAGVSSFAQVGIFRVTATVKPGVDPALVERRLDALIAELLAKGPSGDEVRRVATSVVSGRIGGMEAVGGKASTLAQGALYSNDPARYRTQLAEIAAATPEQVRAAAAKWLGRPALTIQVDPGARDAYVDAVAPVAVKHAPDVPAKGTRGALPDVGTIRDLEFPSVQRDRLKNGIELVYARRGAVPVTQMVVSFDAGVAADPADALGTQTLALSLMDEGTERLNSTQLAEARERLGARIGTGSSADRTYLSLYTPSPNLAASTALLADVVRHPAFAGGEIERVKAQLLAAIAQEKKSPGGMAERALPTLLYGASPYARLAAGSGDPAVVARLTRDDMVAFHRAWIRPDKAKVFVMSDRPLAEVKAALNSALGDWKPVGAAGVKAFDVPATPSAPKIVLVDRPDSPQSLIVGGQVTALDSRGDLLPVVSANEVLGSGFLSRINMDLREAKGWSYGAFGRVGRLEHLVTYQVSAPVQANRTGEAIAAVRTQVGEFLTTRGVTQGEFARTVNGQTRELAGNFETGGAVLSAMQTNDLYRRRDDYYATLPGRYRALTAGQMDAAMRGAIDPAKFVWVVVGDAKVVRPQLDRLGLQVEVVKGE